MKNVEKKANGETLLRTFPYTLSHELRAAAHFESASYHVGKTVDRYTLAVLGKNVGEAGPIYLKNRRKAIARRIESEGGKVKELNGRVTLKKIKEKELTDIISERIGRSTDGTYIPINRIGGFDSRLASYENIYRIRSSSNSPSSDRGTFFVGMMTLPSRHL